jgi:hypothetical protein
MWKLTPKDTPQTSQGNVRRTSRANRTRFRPGLEPMEGRVVLSTFTVTNLNDRGAGSLRAEIAAANGHAGTDRIVFAPGLSGTIGLTSGELLIADNLTIAGPGASVLKVSGEARSRVFEVAAGSTVTIGGLTVENGSAALGGGILNGGTLTVTASRLVGNTAVLGGAIDNNVGAALTVTGRSTLDRNSAAAAGGAIENFGSLTVTGSTLAGNSTNNGGAIENEGTATVSGGSTLASDHANSSGGAIINFGSLTVTGSTLTGDQASGFGGGIDNLGGTVTVGGSAFTLDLVNGFGGFGAGIANESGSMTVTGSTFSQGFAVGGGGGIYNGGGTLSASGDTFANNEALFGGGVLNTGVAHLSYLTFDSDLASSGGAISNGTYSNQRGTLTLDHSTLTRNWADIEGGGIENWAALTVSNSSIVNNQVAIRTGGGIENHGSLTIIDSTITGNKPDNLSGNPPRYE